MAQANCVSLNSTQLWLMKATECKERININTPSLRNAQGLPSLGDEIRQRCKTEGGGEPKWSGCEAVTNCLRVTHN